MAGQEQLIGLLQNSNFTLVYSDVCQLMEGDVTSALLMSRFVSLEEHFKQSGQLVGGEWFYQSVEPIERELSINDHQQRRCLKYLQSLGYLDHEVFGFPKRRYIRLHMDAFLSDLSALRGNVKMEELEETKRIFYALLNKAWTLDDFAVALDKIPRDIGELMYAWTHGYKRTTGKDWVWTPRDFGVLKQYWNGVYRKIRHFDYERLQDYLTSCTAQEPATISKFINYDKSTPDRVITVSLKQHVKKDYSIFK